MGKRTREKGSYSVMQSDRNSFCSDVVVDSVNMASIDEVYKTRYMKSMKKIVIAF